MSNQAFVIGEFLGADVTVEKFQSTVVRLHYDLDIIGDYAKALRRLKARSTAQPLAEQDLILLCVGPNVLNIRELLEGLRAPNRQVIVYAHARRASGRIAIEYCRSGLAHDFLVWGERVSRVEERVTALFDGECPYPFIDVPFVQTDGVPRVFIATPYDTEYRLMMSRAVDPALNAVRLRPCWADVPYRDTPFPDDIRTLIQQSALLIANIRQGRESINNPNVYYEAGQASALGIPVIFVRPLEEKDLVVPADISSRRRIEYDNEIDLAMRLYHGLRR